jgi:hypothetical protein
LQLSFRVPYQWDLSCTESLRVRETALQISKCAGNIKKNSFKWKKEKIYLKYEKIWNFRTP